mmetsp:Transcript_30014/g.77434  ORF Transcript_30014/g.77434 Transcript_30014/m.77434 type:complete len:345 (-) Transcript_30014:247-1281(-)
MDSHHAHQALATCNLTEKGGNFSTAQYDAILYANYATNGLTIALSFISIVVFLAIKELHKFSFRLIFYLSISDFLFGLGMVMQPMEPIRAEPLSVDCYLQAWLQSFATASIFWGCFIAFTLERVIRHRMDNVQRMEKFFHIICWIFVLAVTVIPQAQGLIGPAGAWCWIKATMEDGCPLLIGEVWRIINFFGPLWFGILWCAVIYSLIVQNVRITMSEARKSVGKTFDKRRKKDLKAIARLFAYPPVLIVGGSIGTANRIQNYIDPQSPSFLLAILEVSTLGLMGAANACIFLSNKTVKKALKKRCGCGEGRKQPPVNLELTDIAKNGTRPSIAASERSERSSI